MQQALEALGHTVTPPNGFETSATEKTAQEPLSADAYAAHKAALIRNDGVIVAANDAVFVLNFEKHGQPNYIGGAVFLEMFKAFDLRKKIFLYNPIPENILSDEIIGLQPVIINHDLTAIV